MSVYKVKYMYKPRLSGDAGLALGIIYQAVRESKSKSALKRSDALRFLRSDDCQTWLNLATGAMGYTLPISATDALDSLVESLEAANLAKARELSVV